MKMRFKKPFILAVIALLLIAGFAITRITHAPVKNTATLPTIAQVTTVITPTITNSQEVELRGEVSCLPHKNTNGPQTLECAIGLKTEDGTYYALDMNQTASGAPNVNAGEHIQVQGSLTPIESLDSDKWQKYNIKGVLSVKNKIEKIRE